MANLPHICRICLSVNVKMYTFRNTDVEDVYKLLAQVDKEDGKPSTVCFLCYTKLQKCKRLQQQAVKSNVLLEQLLRDGFMQANAMLNNQNTIQDLQVSSIHQLELKPANCEEVTSDPLAEANSLIMIKEEKDEGYYVTDLEPTTCEDVFLDPKDEANSLTLIKEEKEAINEDYNVLGFPEDAPSNFDQGASHLDPEDDEASMATDSDKSDGINNITNRKEGRKRHKIDNLCIIQQEKEVTNCPHPPDLIQIPIKNRIYSDNEEVQEMNMNSERNLKRIFEIEIEIESVKKKKSTFITNKLKFQEPVDYEDARFDERSEKNWKKAKTYLMSNEEKSQKSIRNECTTAPETSLNDSQQMKADTLKSILPYMYSCDICTFKTNRRVSIVSHLKMHNGSKVFSCNICEVRCLRKRDFKRHMKEHKDEKPFSCNICEYKSIRKGDLTAHMRTHTGEKPFSCNICDYRSAQQTYLKYHMRTHTGEKPFSCNICEYRCTRKTQLVRHSKIHTGEKPFSCNICDYRFAQKHHLTRHIRKHTG